MNTKPDNNYLFKYVPLYNLYSLVIIVIIVNKAKLLSAEVLNQAVRLRQQHRGIKVADNRGKTEKIKTFF